MKKNILLCISILTYFLGFSQVPESSKKEDSVLKVITTLKEDKEVYKLYKWLSQYFLGVNAAKETEYLNKAIFTAEQTRDREFIATAAINQIDQLLDLGGIADRQEKALLLADKAIALAKESQLNDAASILLTKKAYVYRAKADYTTAIKFNEEAVNYAELGSTDSIKVITEIAYANTLLAKDENLAAFKKYVNALNLAETIGNDNLKINAYKRIAEFYMKIDQIEKSKDYYAKVIKMAKKNKDENSELDAYRNLVMYLGVKKDFVSAREYLKLYNAKITKNSNDFLKNSSKLMEVNLLLQEDEKKVSAYIRNNPSIVNDLTQWGYESEANKALGIMYSLENRKDSAEYYFKKSKSLQKPNENIVSIISWNQAYAMHLQRNGDLKNAIGLVEDNLKMAEHIASLSYQKAFREVLDSMYIKSGNKQMEVANKLVLYKLKDSLEKQEKAKDVLNIEIDAENKRIEREEKEKAEKLRLKHNLQYMGITAGIVTLFIVLAALGRFRVRPWFIRALGFFAFILLFEFIILLADTKIHHLTHGDPLQILLIKIVLIAILLPLHHWLEHKAIHYLLRHQHKEISPVKEVVS